MSDVAVVEELGAELREPCEEMSSSPVTAGTTKRGPSTTR
jgi:hypothetical protein